MINEKVAPIGESEMKFTELMFAVAIGVNMLFIAVGVVTMALGKLNIGMIVLGIGFIGFTITTTANYVVSLLRPFKSDEELASQNETKQD